MKVWYGGEIIFSWFFAFINFYTLPKFSYYFSSQIDLLSNSFIYAKYFVLIFSIDIVSTLSNYIYQSLQIMFILDRRRRSLAAATPVVYE